MGALRRLGEDAAAAAGLDVFGGDVIVGSSGELTLIDLNDWPSFAPCRDADTPELDHWLREFLYFAQFSPATALGKPVDSKVILSFVAVRS